jgi:hypothetical protein
MLESGSSGSVPGGSRYGRPYREPRRNAPLRRSPPEGPECGCLPTFRCEREMGFTESLASVSDRPQFDPPGSCRE